jgi:hypothetical protein
MRRLHRERRLGVTAREHPEILGDVFAWNKLFRTSFWRAQGLEWPEGVRYEDQPTSTRAFLAGKGLDVDAIAPLVDEKFFSAFVRARKPAATPCCGPTCCA